MLEDEKEKLMSALKEHKITDEETQCSSQVAILILSNMRMVYGVEKFDAMINECALRDTNIDDFIETSVMLVKIVRESRAKSG